MYLKNVKYFKKINQGFEKTKCKMCTQKIWENLYLQNVNQAFENMLKKYWQCIQ